VTVEFGTAQEQALAAVRRLLVTARLRPGQRVLQDEIAQTLGMSVAPLREALRVLEQEGQLTYFPRRGYFVTELRAGDLDEIYGLRAILEARAIREGRERLGDPALTERLKSADAACLDAAEAGDVARGLAANRAFHFALFETAERPHLLKLIKLLWDSSEVYRALYYSAPVERNAAARAHRRIVSAARAGDVDRLLEEIDAHRTRALEALRRILPP